MNTWTIHQHFNESRKKDKKQWKNVLPGGRKTMEIKQEDAKCPCNIKRSVPRKSYGFNKLTNTRNYSKVSVLGVNPYSLRAKLN